MDLITSEEALQAEELLDELRGLGQIRWGPRPKAAPSEERAAAPRWGPRPKAAPSRERAAAASQRACGYEAGALRQAATQRTLANNALAQAARVIPDAQERRKALLAQARSYKAAAEDWGDRAAAFGRQCRGTAKESSV